MRLYLFTAFLLLASVHVCHGDWWDDFVESVSTKLHEGAQFVKDKAGPAIREKFDGAKEKLQDPETHADVQHWFKEKVWKPTKEFVTSEVAPEIKKIYNAAVEGNEKLKEREGSGEPNHEK